MAEMKRFSQQDPRRKSELLGFDKEATLGIYGCLARDRASRQPRASHWSFGFMIAIIRCRI